MKLKYKINPEENVCQFYRQLTVSNIGWAIISSCAYINCEVTFGEYVINEEKIEEFLPLNLQMYPNYKITLVMDNSTLVNPANGNQVIDGESIEDCIMGEYDFFIMCLNNNVSLATVLESGINRSILRGRHNI